MGLNKSRGLSSLLGDMDEVYSKELGLDKNQISKIKIEKIRKNPFQPRKNFDENALNELAQSIKEYGLIQPIIVLKKGEEFILVAGERRLRASEILGFDEILAFVSDADEKKLRELALIENIQREELNPIELAQSYKDLIQEHKITQENLANLLHKSRTQITNTMRLLNLSEKTQKLIIEGKISQGHAKNLVGLEKNDEEMLVNSILGQRLNVRDTEKIASKIKKKSEKSAILDREFQNEIKKAEKRLNSLGFECKIRGENFAISFKSTSEIQKFLFLLEKI